LEYKKNDEEVTDDRRGGLVCRTGMLGGIEELDYNIVYGVEDEEP
jgi:hypothetical protein